MNKHSRELINGTDGALTSRNKLTIFNNRDGEMTMHDETRIRQSIAVATVNSSE